MTGPRREDRDDGTFSAVALTGALAVLNADQTSLELKGAAPSETATALVHPTTTVTTSRPASTSRPTTTRPTTTRPVVTRPTATTRASSPTATTRASNTTATQAHYANCTAVQAAGKAPLLRGQPGYRAGLDRDGVACET